MKILWVIPKWTFPVTDGARVATDRLLRNTKSEDIEIDVLCLGQSNEKIDKNEMTKEWGVGKIDFISRSLPHQRKEKLFYYLKKLILNPSTPLTFSSFTDKELINKIAQATRNRSYDYLMLDGLHLAGPFLSKERFKLPFEVNKIVYRAHNIEEDLWLKGASDKKNPLYKAFLYFQAMLVRKFEKTVIEQADITAAISQEDLDIIKNIAPSSKSYLTPLGLDFSKPLVHENHLKTNLLFVGRLDWPPNKDGLEWLLKEVWPEVVKIRDDIKLTVVGSGDRSWLEKYKHLEKLNLLGFVDDIKDAYRGCDFTVVPVFYGSGTRIKVMESYAMGRNLISTRMGVQGAGLSNDDYLNAETKEEWIELLSNVQLSKTNIDSLEKAREKLIMNFDSALVGRNFAKNLEENL